MSRTANDGPALTWEDTWRRVMDPTVPVGTLIDAELEEVAAIGETRAELEAWVLAEREDDQHAVQRARRRAADPRYAGRVEQDVAVMRARRDAARQRIRISAEDERPEWTAKYRRLFESIADRQNAEARRSIPLRFQRALRRVRVVLAPRRRPACSPTPRARPRARRRPRGTRRSSSRSGDSGDGPGEPPAAPDRPRRCRPGCPEVRR